MDTFTFNVQPLSDFVEAPLSERYWQCVTHIREVCGELVYPNIANIRQTRENHNQPNFNIILETERPPRAVTVKIRKKDVYVIGYRKGRGEPNGIGNNGEWYRCRRSDAAIPESREAGFRAAYTSVAFENRQNLNAADLSNAVLNLWDGENEEHAFFSIVIQLAEGARFNVIANGIRGIMEVNEFGRMEFEFKLKELCKNWLKVCDDVRGALESPPGQENQPIISIDGFRHLARDDAIAVVAMLKHRVPRLRR